MSNAMMGVGDHPLAGPVETAALLVAIVLTVSAFARVSRPAVLLLMPYLLWTGGAARRRG